MKNPLCKIASISLASILTLSLFPVYSKVSASTEEPEEFMSLKEKYKPQSPINDLKKDIKKDYESLFSESNLQITLNILRFNKCKLLPVIIKYIYSHPALGIKLRMNPIILKKASNLNRETLLSDIIEYSEFVDDIKKEAEHLETLETSCEYQVEEETVEGNLKDIAKPSEVFRILNEGHLILSEYIIRLYKNLGTYESLLQLNNATLTDTSTKSQEINLPRFSLKPPRKKSSYFK